MVYLSQEVLHGGSVQKEFTCSRDPGLIPTAFQIPFGFPAGSDGKESAYNAGDSGSNPGLGRSPGEGHGDPLLYSCLENSLDRRAWRTTVYVVRKSQKWLSD